MFSLELQIMKYYCYFKSDTDIINPLHWPFLGIVCNLIIQCEQSFAV